MRTLYLLLILLCLRVEARGEETGQVGITYITADQVRELLRLRECADNQSYTNHVMLDATLTVVVQTNTFYPKQWKVPHMGCLVYGCTQQFEWIDAEPNIFPNGGIYPSLFNQNPETRDNTDLRITEVREIKTLTFEFDGKPYSIEHSNQMLSSKREKRVVTTETTQTNETTTTTTVERWEETE